MTPADAATLPRLGEHQTLQEMVYLALRRSLIDGTFRPGQRLRQDTLATQLGVSTMPVREALRRLEAEGLVNISPRRGATVSDLRSEELEEIFLLRIRLETLAAQLGVPNLTRGNVEQMHKTLDDIDDANRRGDLAAFLRLDRQFHSVLRDAARRPLLATFITTLWNRSDPYRRASVFQSDRALQAQDEHRELLSACEAGDAEKAARFTQLNIQRTADELSARFRASSQPEHTPTNRGEDATRVRRREPK